MENLPNTAPQWALDLEKRVDNLLQVTQPKEKKEPEKQPKKGKEKPTANTDKEIETWAKGNRDGKIYGNY